MPRSLFRVLYFITVCVVALLILVVNHFGFIGTVYNYVVYGTELKNVRSDLDLSDRMAPSNKSKRRSSLGVPGLIQSCGKIFDNFPYTYQYKAASRNDCQKTITLSSQELPLTALASYPGSGNTWLRYLLQQATGLATGSMYCDLNLKRNGFFAESMRNGSVVAVKTHVFLPAHLAHFSRAIVLTRDPRDALLADFNREYTHSHTQQVSQDLFSIRWHAYWSRRLNKWTNFHKQWLSFHGKLLLVRYECLRSQLSTELTKILEFLGLPRSPGVLNCIEAYSRGQFKREKNDTAAAGRKLEIHKNFDDLAVSNILRSIFNHVKNNSDANVDSASLFQKTTCS